MLQSCSMQVTCFNTGGGMAANPKNAPTKRAAPRPRTYLAIDYDSKEWAKRHGARWDKDRKRWYVLGDVPEMLMPYVDASMAGQAPKVTTEEERQKVRARATAARPKSVLREPPPGDAQADFFVPGVWDVATKDNRGIMDVAVVRLSKKYPRANDVMLHTLPDGYVRVTSGPDGMATIWDYDIVLMGISYLTEAMNRYRAGLGEKPGKIYRPYVSDIQKFCRKGDGGRQNDDVEAALRRLKQTMLEIVRSGKRSRRGRPIRETTGAGLINDYKAVSYEDTGRIVSVEIELPNWLYTAVVEAENTEVLTMHPDYFLVTSGIGRFVYRLARVAAGKGEARWSFRTLYERSGSTGTFKEFSRGLREVINANDLPEYTLAEIEGQEGPVLEMTNRLTSSRALESGQGGG